MKRLFIALAAMLAFSVSVNAQTIVKDAKGNYTAVKAARDSTKSVDKATGGTYTDTHGKISPVYSTNTGRIYAIITSKNGKEYRKYLDKPAKVN